MAPKNRTAISYAELKNYGLVLIVRKGLKALSCGHYYSALFITILLNNQIDFDSQIQ